MYYTCPDAAPSAIVSASYPRGCVASSILRGVVDGFGYSFV